MADFSISMEKGVGGFKLDDFVVGTLSPNAGTVEIRIEDDDAATAEDVILLLKAAIRFFETRPLFTTYPKL